MDDYLIYSRYIDDPSTPISPSSPMSLATPSRLSGPSGPTNPLGLLRLDTTPATYLPGPISAAPINDDDPDPEPTGLGSPNGIVFPLYRRGDSTDTQASKFTILSTIPLLSKKSSPSPQTSFRPHQLSKSILESKNASDHLRRIHITSSQYCRKQNNGQEFITFSVVDSALPHITNLLILDRNGRRVMKSDNSQESQHIARCWVFNLLPITVAQSLIERIKPPGRIYISNAMEDQAFLSLIGFDAYAVMHELTLSSEPAFSLEHLLVLATGLATPLRFRHPHSMQPIDWYPKSMWEAIQLVTEFIQNEEPLPAPLQLRDVSMDGALLEKVLAKYADNLRVYRSRVMRRQQREDSNPAVQEKREREIQAEVERHNQEIENQKKESLRLEQEREELAREQQRMREEIERLKRAAGETVASEVHL